MKGQFTTERAAHALFLSALLPCYVRVRTRPRGEGVPRTAVLAVLWLSHDSTRRPNERVDFFVTR